MERGHLLSIRTLKENRWVTSRIRQIRRVLGFSKFWIGASDIGHQGVYEWTEKNSTVTYTRSDTEVLANVVVLENGRGRTSELTLDRAIERANERLNNERTNERTSERTIEQRTNSAITNNWSDDRTSKQAIEQRTNERLNEPWTDERTSNWTNERLNEQKKEGGQDGRMELEGGKERSWETKCQGHW